MSVRATNGSSTKGDSDIVLTGVASSGTGGSIMIAVSSGDSGTD